MFTSLYARRWLCGAAVGLLLLFAVAVLALLFMFDPRQYSFYPKCQLHSLTGLNCAGCGTLRAMHHLLHGEFLLAFRSNALLIFALVGLGWLGFRWLVGEPLGLVIQNCFTRPALALALVGIVFVFTVLRNLPWKAFAWMSP